jgi:hypothetical protein
LPIRKIISVQLYSDGIELHRDGISAKPHIFLVDDPAFVANVIAGLSQI